MGVVRGAQKGELAVDAIDVSIEAFPVPVGIVCQRIVDALERLQVGEVGKGKAGACGTEQRRACLQEIPA